MTENQAVPASSASSWLNRPWMAFDTETTGISPRTDRVVTAAIVTRNPGGETQVRNWLMNPGIDIPQRATDVHGVTTDHAREFGQDPRDALDEINDVLAAQMQGEQVVVIFNAGYDLPLLEADSKRHGVRTLVDRLGRDAGPVLDPLVLDRAMDRYRKGKRTLSAMAMNYGISVPDDTHQAHVDSMLTLDVLAAILRAYPKLTEMDADQIQRFQRDSYGLWAREFRQFLASKGRNSDISETWF